MKLYTQDQVKKAIAIGIQIGYSEEFNIDNFDMEVEDALFFIPPIELPYPSKHLKQPTMKLTAMQDLIDDFDRYLKLDLSSEALNMIQLIKERAEQKLLMERQQIESAYDSAKNDPDADGSKYYFMNYITND